MQASEKKQRVIVITLWVIFCALAVCVLAGVIYYIVQTSSGHPVNLPLIEAPAQEQPSGGVQAPPQPQQPGGDATPMPPVAATPTPPAQLFYEPTFTPTMTFTITPTPFADVYTYIVQWGDNLSQVARYFEIDPERIKRSNRQMEKLGIDDGILVNKMALIIPAEGAPNPAPVLTSFNENGSGIYTVQEQDTLESIAAQFNVNRQYLRISNGMVGDNVLAGQTILIPVQGRMMPTPWSSSALGGDLVKHYPATLERDRFTLHYVPDTHAARAIYQLADMEQKALDFLEQLFGQPLEKRFDVYVAHSLFSSPENNLRGKSESASRRNFLLFDGTGTRTDQQYMAAHELTHLYTWNVFGIPTSTMLSEGVAVYVGTEMIAGSPQTPLEEFCAALLKAGQLPYVASSLTYSGHNYNLLNYYAAGCFVRYLVQTYGTESFGRLYPGVDYIGVYHKPLQMLEEEWRVYLSSVPVTRVQPEELFDAANRVTKEYQKFFPGFQKAPGYFRAYRRLDAARIAMLEGRFEDMRIHMDAYQGILNGTQ